MTNQLASKDKAVIEKEQADKIRAVQIYREGVEDLLKLKINKNISNGMPEHAAVLFEMFFKHASSRVRIFCQNLSAKVFNEATVVEAAKHALKKNVKIEIIVQNDPPDQSSFLEFIKNNQAISIRKIKIDTLKNIDVNFSVMDDRAYRFEPKRNDIAANANMNLPEIASLLINKFEDLKVYSEPVVLV